MGKQSSKLKKKHLTQLEGETLFTKDEIRERYKRFLEEGRKGKITVDQLGQIYTKLLPARSAAAFAKLTFRMYDENHDGCIDFRDFLVVLSVTTRGTQEQKLRLIFRMYDLDGDGYVTKPEMLEVLTAIAKMVPMKGDGQNNTSPEESVRVIFERMDTGVRERLSKRDFVQGILKDPGLVPLLRIKDLFGCW